mgnify:CR=1 FL=1
MFASHSVASAIVPAAPRPVRSDLSFASFHDGVVCDGCGERGHVQEDCPHRSDIEDEED